MDDLVSGGGKHRSQNVWCLFWVSKETLMLVISVFCEAHENIQKHGVWSRADTPSHFLNVCVDSQHGGILSTNLTILPYVFALEHISSKTTFASLWVSYKSAPYI